MKSHLSCVLQSSIESLVYLCPYPLVTVVKHVLVFAEMLALGKIKLTCNFWRSLSEELLFEIESSL